MPLFERDSRTNHWYADNIYVVNEIVRHVGSGPCLYYLERKYSYSMEHDTSVLSQQLLQHFLYVYWHTIYKPSMARCFRRDICSAKKVSEHDTKTSRLRRPSSLYFNPYLTAYFSDLLSALKLEATLNVRCTAQRCAKV